MHHAPQEFQISDIFLLDAHLSQLSRDQIELGHLVVVAVHDRLQFFKLVTAQTTDQVLQFLTMTYVRLIHGQ